MSRGANSPDFRKRFWGIEKVDIKKEKTVVTKIALTISLGFTLYAAHRAKENAPHGPSDTKKVPKKSFG